MIKRLSKQIYSYAVKHIKLILLLKATIRN